MKGEFDAVLKQTTEAGKQGADAGSKAESEKASEAKGTAETKEAPEAPPEAEQTNDVSQKEDAVHAQDEAAAPKETGQPETEEAVELPDDLSDKTEVLERAGGEMMAHLAAQMGIPQETVKAAMEDLGMTEVSLLEPGNVKALMVHLTEGADDMSILTDESFYAAVTEALDTLAQITDDAREETGMSSLEWKAAVQEVERQLAAPVEPETEMMPQEAPEKAQILQEPVVLANMPQGNVKQGEAVAVENAPKAELAEGEPEEATAAPEKAQEVTSKEMPAEAPRETAKEMPKRESAGKDGRNPFAGNSYQAGNMGFRAAVAAAAQTAEAESAFPMAQMMEIMDQIMDYMKVSVKPEATSLEMQLHPESLGTLHIQITNREGAVTAQFIAQNESVKAALESQVVQLKENLEQQGVKVEAVEVTVAEYSLERNPGGDQGEANQGGGKQRKGIRNLNLGELDLEEEGDLTQEERLTAQVMQASGSTVNYTA